MSGFKGMPGPWAASKYDRSIGPVSKDDDQSYGIINPVAWIEFDGNEAFQAANASLIAAAPELLEALQDVVAAIKTTLRVGHERIIELGGDCDSPEVMIEGHADIARAEAAIAKALGQ